MQMNINPAMNRRQFLRTTTAGLLIPVAPAIVKAEWLMPVKALKPTCFCIDTPYGFNEGDLWAENGRLHTLTKGGWILIEESPRYRSDEGLRVVNGYLSDMHQLFPERRIYFE